ncbi:MAG TPA: hypothetical protein PKC96_01955 [Bacilli bacterium]|nr:hypothetical protein [Bacilli bacterium]
MGKYYIKIIVEGNEEKVFFDIVEQLATNEKFALDVENANGCGGIADAFLSALREDALFDCVICVYDVDNKIKDTNSPYNIVRRQLMLLFEDDSIVDSISFCTNPNILQFFLLAANCLNQVALTSTSKSTNSEYVHRYWPAINSKKTDELGRKIKPEYNASKWQLEIIKYSIINNEYTYSNLLENARSLPQNYKENLPASNLLPMLNALKDGDENFFKKINALIEKIE